MPLLPIAELVALADSDELPESRRDAVAASLEARPEAAEGLRAARDRVPEPPVADPFVSALRRLAWPSERLPLRHRRAIEGVGRELHGFRRLVVEEARTFSWRNESPNSLSTVARWLVPWAEAEGAPQALQLAAQALGSRNLVAMVTTVFDDLDTLDETFLELAAFAEMVGDRLEDPIEVEGAMSLLITQAFTGKELGEIPIDELVGDKAQDSDTRILVAYLKGFIGGILGGDENVAVDAFLKALELRDADTDPWFEFFLRYSAASALVNASGKRVPDLKSLFNETIADVAAKPEFLEKKRVRPRDVVFSRYQEALQTEYWLRREPALRHLEAIEPLFQEFRTPEMAVQYYWLLVECHRAFDVYQALDYCCDAVLAAEAVDPEDSRIEHMLTTAALIRHMVHDYGKTPFERVIAVDRRVEEILAPRLRSRFQAYKAAKKLPRRKDSSA